jgi:hypothetical protein
MSDVEIDLNLQNYELNDLLNLFKIPCDFGESDLKRAKQIVLKTHPDKSKLPRDYFIFYSKAYKTLFSIWEFRQKIGHTKNTDYVADSEKAKSKLLDSFFQKNNNFKESPDKFNEWFNSQFEKNKLSVEVEEKGYGNWLKEENTDDIPDNISSMSKMHEEFSKKKAYARFLIVREEIQDLWTMNSVQASELTGDAPQTYDSGLFSGLGYQDLYKAHHTETVIPVTEEDYQSTLKFNNVNEIMQYRNTQDTTPLSEKQALQYLKQREKREEEQSVVRGYELAKQMENAQKKQQDFWASIQLLK